MNLSRRSLVALAAVAAMFSFAAPASALTLEQAQAELAGYYCGGSACTLSVDGTRDEIVTIFDSHSRRDGAHSVSGSFSDVCFWGNGKPMLGVDPVTCASAPISPGSYERTKTHDETVVIATRTTTTKVLVYNGPNTDRAHAWSITTTVETVDLP